MSQREKILKDAGYGVERTGVSGGDGKPGQIFDTLDMFVLANREPFYYENGYSMQDILKMNEELVGGRRASSAPGDPLSFADFGMDRNGIIDVSEGASDYKEFGPLHIRLAREIRKWTESQGMTVKRYMLLDNGRSLAMVVEKGRTQSQVTLLHPFPNRIGEMRVSQDRISIPMFRSTPPDLLALINVVTGANGEVLGEPPINGELPAEAIDISSKQNGVYVRSGSTNKSSKNSGEYYVIPRMSIADDNVRDKVRGKMGAQVQHTIYDAEGDGGGLSTETLDFSRVMRDYGGLFPEEDRNLSELDLKSKYVLVKRNVRPLSNEYGQALEVAGVEPSAVSSEFGKLVNNALWPLQSIYDPEGLQHKLQVSYIPTKEVMEARRTAQMPSQFSFGALKQSAIERLRKNGNQQAISQDGVILNRSELARLTTPEDYQTLYRQTSRAIELDEERMEKVHLPDDMATFVEWCIYQARLADPEAELPQIEDLLDEHGNVDIRLVDIDLIRDYSKEGLSDIVEMVRREVLRLNELRRQTGEEPLTIDAYREALMTNYSKEVPLYDATGTMTREPSSLFVSNFEMEIETDEVARAEAQALNEVTSERDEVIAGEEDEVELEGNIYQGSRQRVANLLVGLEDAAGESMSGRLNLEDYSGSERAYLERVLENAEAAAKAAGISDYVGYLDQDFVLHWSGTHFSGERVSHRLGQFFPMDAQNVYHTKYGSGEAHHIVSYFEANFESEGYRNPRSTTSGLFTKNGKIKSYAKNQIPKNYENGLLDPEAVVLDARGNLDLEATARRLEEIDDHVTQERMTLASRLILQSIQQRILGGIATNIKQQVDHRVSDARSAEDAFYDVTRMNAEYGKGTKVTDEKLQNPVLIKHLNAMVRFSDQLLTRNNFLSKSSLTESERARLGRTDLSMSQKQAAVQVLLGPRYAIYEQILQDDWGRLAQNLDRWSQERGTLPNGMSPEDFKREVLSYGDVTMSNDEYHDLVERLRGEYVRDVMPGLEGILDPRATSSGKTIGVKTFLTDEFLDYVNEELRDPDSTMNTRAGVVGPKIGTEMTSGRTKMQRFLEVDEAKRQELEEIFGDLILDKLNELPDPEDQLARGAIYRQYMFSPYVKELVHNYDAIHDSPDRVMMAQSNAVDGISVVGGSLDASTWIDPETGEEVPPKKARVAFMNLGGQTYEDAIIMSKDMAEYLGDRYGYGRPLVKGDKIMDMHSNKGVISYISGVDEDDPNYNKEIEAFFADNPDVNIVQSAYGMSSRANSGLAREFGRTEDIRTIYYPEGHPLEFDENGERRVYGVSGEISLILTAMRADQKVALYALEKSTKRRRLSLQQTVAIQAHGAEGVLNEVFGLNAVRNFEEFHHYLNANGWALTDEGNGETGFKRGQYGMTLQEESTHLRSGLTGTEEEAKLQVYSPEIEELLVYTPFDTMPVVDEETGLRTSSPYIPQGAGYLAIPMLFESGYIRPESDRGEITHRAYYSNYVSVLPGRLRESSTSLDGEELASAFTKQLERVAKVGMDVAEVKLLLLQQEDVYKALKDYVDLPAYEDLGEIAYTNELMGQLAKFDAGGIRESLPAEALTQEMNDLISRLTRAESRLSRSVSEYQGSVERDKLGVDTRSRKASHLRRNIMSTELQRSSTVILTCNTSRRPDTIGLSPALAANSGLLRLLDQADIDLAEQAVLAGDMDQIQTIYQDAFKRGRIMYTYPKPTQGRTGLENLRDVYTYVNDLPEDFVVPEDWILVENTEDGRGNYYTHPCTDEDQFLNRIMIHRDPITKKGSTVGTKFKVDPTLYGADINPLIIDQMGADFDGDQIAVFVPATIEAQRNLAHEMAVENTYVNIRGELDLSFGMDNADYFNQSDIAARIRAEHEQDSEPKEYHRTLEQFREGVMELGDWPEPALDLYFAYYNEDNRESNLTASIIQASLPLIKDLRITTDDVDIIASYIDDYEKRYRVTAKQWEVKDAYKAAEYQKQAEARRKHREILEASLISDDSKLQEAASKIKEFYTNDFNGRAGSYTRTMTINLARALKERGEALPKDVETFLDYQSELVEIGKAVREVPDTIYEVREGADLNAKDVLKIYRNEMLQEAQDLESKYFKEHFLEREQYRDLFIIREYLENTHELTAFEGVVNPEAMKVLGPSKLGRHFGKRAVMTFTDEELEILERGDKIAREAYEHGCQKLNDRLTEFSRRFVANADGEFKARYMDPTNAETFEASIRSQVEDGVKGSEGSMRRAMNFYNVEVTWEDVGKTRKATIAKSDETGKAGAQMLTLSPLLQPKMLSVLNRLSGNKDDYSGFARWNGSALSLEATEGPTQAVLDLKHDPDKVPGVQRYLENISKFSRGPLTKPTEVVGINVIASDNYEDIVPNYYEDLVERGIEANELGPDVLPDIDSDQRVANLRKHLDREANAMLEIAKVMDKASLRVKEMNEALVRQGEDPYVQLHVDINHGTVLIVDSREAQEQLDLNAPLGSLYAVQPFGDHREVNEAGSKILESYPPRHGMDFPPKAHQKMLDERFGGQVSAKGYTELKQQTPDLSPTALYKLSLKGEYDKIGIDISYREVDAIQSVIRDKGTFKNPGLMVPYKDNLVEQASSLDLIAGRGSRGVKDLIQSSERGEQERKIFAGSKFEDVLSPIRKIGDQRWDKVVMAPSHEHLASYEKTFAKGYEQYKEGEQQKIIEMVRNKELARQAVMKEQAEARAKEVGLKTQEGPSTGQKLAEELVNQAQKQASLQQMLRTASIGLEQNGHYTSLPNAIDTEPGSMSQTEMKALQEKVKSLGLTSTKPLTGKQVLYLGSKADGILEVAKAAREAFSAPNLEGEDLKRTNAATYMLGRVYSHVEAKGDEYREKYPEIKSDMALGMKIAQDYDPALYRYIENGTYDKYLKVAKLNEKGLVLKELQASRVELQAAQAKEREREERRREEEERRRKQEVALAPEMVAGDELMPELSDEDMALYDKAYAQAQATMQQAMQQDKGMEMGGPNLGV